MIAGQLGTGRYGEPVTETGPAVDRSDLEARLFAPNLTVAAVL